MLKKLPKSWVKLGLKVGIAGAALELACLGGSYLFWRQLNTNQEFRQYCSVNLPVALEAYYKIGDYLDPEKTKEVRKVDQITFEKALKDIETNKKD